MHSMRMALARSAPGKATGPAAARAPERIPVFAYGSMMLSACMRARVPSAEAIGIGCLPGYVLKWHQPGADGSGKCDIERTARSKDVVWGVIFGFDAADKPAIARAEGLGRGYVERLIDVVTDAGIVRASAFVATARHLTLRPYHWYKALVVTGAREHGLSTEYIEQLESTPSNRDFDAARTAEGEKLIASSQPPHAVPDV